MANEPTVRDEDIEEAVLDMISQDRTEAEQRAYEAELAVEAQAIEIERLRELLRRVVMDWGSLCTQADCDCSLGQARREAQG